MLQQSRATLKAIPNGAAGTRETLRIMARLVREYRKSLPIRELALSIVRQVAGHKNFRGQVAALHSWVQDNIQYVRDIEGVETVQTPLKTLDYMQGDCDDQSVLLATLLMSVGFRPRFVAIKTDSYGPFCHVFTEVSAGKKWLPLETTERWPAGKGPPNIASAMIENI